MIKKLLCAALSSVFALTAVVGGFSGTLGDGCGSVFAEEGIGETDSLTAGTYIVPLRKVTNIDNTSFIENRASHFYGDAILSISEEETSITIGVENWSLYDAFIPRNQSEFVTNIDTTTLPDYLSSEELSPNLTNFETYRDSLTLTEDLNDEFVFGNKETKYGNIQIDQNEDDKKLDIAYISFDIKDYKEVFAVYSWLNVPNNKSVSASTFYEVLFFSLDYVHAISIDNIADVSNEDWSLNTKLASRRYNASYPAWAQRCFISYDGNDTAKIVFDDILVSKNDDDSYDVKYHINVTNDSTVYTDFKLLDSVNHSTDTYQEWDLLYSGTYTTPTIEDGYLNIHYNDVNDLLMGKYVFFDTEDGTSDKILYFCMASAVPGNYEDFILTDPTTGIYIEANTRELPKNSKLSVTVNGELYKYTTDGEIESNIVESYYKSPLFDSATWYMIALTDENDVPLDYKYHVDVHIPLPDDFNFNDYLLEIRDAQGESIAEYTSQSMYDEATNSIVSKEHLLSGKTFSVLKHSDRSDVYQIDSSNDSIYTADAYFIKRGKEGILSMADAGLTRKVYIVVKDGIKKMYFKTGIVTENAYIGDIYCDNLSVQGGEGAVYEDSISYTDFEMYAGEIVGNCEYDAYTEFANVKGGILTLMDECYIPNAKAYAVALVSPIMCTLSGSPIPYDEIRKDDTVAWLEFLNLKKCDDMTLEDVEADYGYKESALIRQVKIAELKLEEAEEAVLYGIEYSPYAVSNLETLLEKYRNSTNYKEAVTALEAANKKIAVMEYSALNGYNAVLKDDISLNFYLDLTTDVQKKGKVQILLPDGTVEEQNISECKDSTYGYKFTAHVAAKEMASPVTVQVIGADGTVGSEYTYSVKEYAENTLKTSTDESEKALIKAMLNYGGYAQAYFGYAAENPANGSLAENEKSLGEVSVSSNAAKVTDNDANVDFAGANLSLKNKTCLKVYFTLAEGTDAKDITFKVDGTPVEVDGKYCVQIADILPNALSRSYTVTAGDVTVVYSPYSYINEALSASEVPSNRLTELQNVVKALYFYGEAAKAYAAS